MDSITFGRPVREIWVMDKIQSNIIEDALKNRGRSNVNRSVNYHTVWDSARHWGVENRKLEEIYVAFDERNRPVMAAFTEEDLQEAVEAITFTNPQSSFRIEAQSVPD